MCIEKVRLKMAPLDVRFPQGEREACGSAHERNHKNPLQQPCDSCGLEPRAARDVQDERLSPGRFHMVHFADLPDLGVRRDRTQLSGGKVQGPAPKWFELQRT